MTAATKLTDGTCKIIFTFPTGISFFGTVGCTIGTGFKKSLSCSQSSATNTVTASCSSTGTVDTTVNVYVLTLSNIQNPSSAQTVSISVATFASSTAQDTGSGSVVYTAVTLSSSKGSLSTADATVGAYAQFTATLTISNAIPSTGKIYIIFPKWETTAASVRGTMLSQVTSCSASSDIAGNSPTCSTTIGSSEDMVTVSSAFTSTSGLAIGKTLSITITNVRNPPTLSVYSSYAIYTADSSGNYIELCSGLSLILQYVGALSSDSYVSLTGSTQVNQYGTYTCYIKLGDPVPSGGWIRIIVPTDLTVTSSSLTFSALANIDSSSTVTVSSTNTIDIKNGISSYLQEGNGILIKLGNILNPFSTKTTSSFEYYTFDSSNSGIDKKTTGLTVSATQGSLSNVKVYPTDYLGVLEYATTYYFTLKLGNYIDSTSSLVITFPSASFPTVGTRTCTISGLNSGYSCKSDSDSYTITISTFVNSKTVAGTTLSFTISNLYIRNPPTTQKSSTIAVYTAYSGNKIDYDSSATVTAIQANISSMSVTPSSYQTNQDNVIYTFTIVPTGYILQNAYINITLPSEISVTSDRAVSDNCGKTTLSGFNTNSVSCSVDSTNNILIKKGFSKGVSSDPPTLKISIGGLSNPRTLKETSTFTVFIYDTSESYPIYNKTTGVSTQMTSVSTISSVVISRGSTINGALTNYTFTITMNNVFENNDYFLITIPTTNTITFSNTSSCIGISSNIYSSITCTQQSYNTTMKVVLKKRSLRVLDYDDYDSTFRRRLDTSTVSFNITNIKNPISLRRTDTFTVVQYTSEDYKVESKTSGITIQNTNASLLSYSQVSITPTSYQVSASTPYTFSISPTNYATGMYIQIYVPPEITVNTSNFTCEPINGMSLDVTCVYNTTNRTISVINGFPFVGQPKSIKLQISNFTNPDTLMTTSTFKVYTYSSDGYLMDYKDSNMYINFVCSLPCKTCVSNNNTGCSSCYTDSTTTGLPYLLSRNCYETCPVSYYADKSYNCQSCYASYCQSCTDKYMGYCTLCDGNYTLINGNCVKYQDATYFFPFLIFSVIWMIIVFFILMKWDKTWYITSSIIGISFFEQIMMFVEVAVFIYYGFWVNSVITIISIISICLINIMFMICYLVIFKKNEEIIANKMIFKRTHYTLVVLSCVFNNRIFKLIYSNFAERPSISVDEMFSEVKVKKIYYSVSYASLLCTVLTLFNAAYNIFLSTPLQVKITIQIDVERIILSVLLIVLHILEFTVTIRPRFIESFLDKINRQGPKSVNERYNEVASASMLSVPEMDQSYSMNTQQKLIDNTAYNKTFTSTKADAIRQILFNLRKIRPDQLDLRLQEMLEEEEKANQTRDGMQDGQANDLNKKRRASDPAPFSKDNRRSIHYQQQMMKNKANNLMNSSLNLEGDKNDQEDDDDKWERQILSYPLTPTRAKRYGDAGKVNQGQYTFRNEDLQRTNLFGTTIMNGTFKTKRDQEIFMSNNNMNQQLEKIQQEKEELKRLNDELREQRLQLEKEKEEIERLKNEGSKSARGRERNDMLEEVKEKDIHTARGSRSPQKLRNNKLDEVRESQSELIDEEGKGKTRRMNKDRSQVIKSRNQLIGSKSKFSQNSIKSESPSIAPIPHRCHGNSKSTLQAIYKLRENGNNSMSKNSSQADFGSPQRKGSVKSKIDSPFKKNNLINAKLRQGETYVKQTGTKVYYSDKSESSVEDLMDETPSNYNIPNGRFDGKSTGFRFGGGKKNNLTQTNLGGRQQDTVVSEHSTAIDQVNQKKQLPPKLKKFREGGDQEDGSQSNLFKFNNNSGNSEEEDDDDQDYLDSTQIGYRKKIKKKNNPDLERIQNNISNLSMERREYSNTQLGHYNSSTVRESMGTQHNNLLNLNKKNSTSNAIGVSLTGERVKALEVAYLTKLVPQSKTKINPNMKTVTNLQSRTERQGNFTPDDGKNFTALGALQPPQINNFNFQQ